MLFADDTNLFLKGTDLLSLKRETEKAFVELSTWFAQNKLTMSLEKIQYSIFHAKNKTIAMEFNTMNICNTQIKRVKEANYLGLILDENLTFSSHIDYLLKTQICKLFQNDKKSCSYRMQATIILW